MNTIYIFLAIIFAIIIASVGIFLTLTRQGKNFIKTILFNRKYVVCHLQNKNTGYEEVWKVVPPADCITNVGKHHYNLNPKYSILSWKKRLHFVLNEGDVIPEYLNRKGTNEEILIQVDETDTAINTRAYKIIYGKKMDIALIVCGVALFLSLIVAIYAIYTIGKISPLVEWLYAHPPQELGSTTVKIIQP